MSAFEEMMSDPYLSKFFKGLARMLGEFYQGKAPNMSSDELYAISDFLPTYNTELHDYTQKPVGYTCKKDDGTVMTLLGDLGSGIMTTDEVDGEIPKGQMWQCHWSTDPSKAKAFISSDLSPYNTDECCFWDGKVYRSKSDGVCLSPEDDPESWEEVKGVVPE